MRADDQHVRGEVWLTLCKSHIAISSAPSGELNLRRRIAPRCGFTSFSPLALKSIIISKIRFELRGQQDPECLAADSPAFARWLACGTAVAQPTGKPQNRRSDPLLAGRRTNPHFNVPPWTPRNRGLHRFPGNQKLLASGLCCASPSTSRLAQSGDAEVMGRKTTPFLCWFPHVGRFLLNLASQHRQCARHVPVAPLGQDVNQYHGRPAIPPTANSQVPTSTPNGANPTTSQHSGNQKLLT